MYRANWREFDTPFTALDTPLIEGNQTPVDAPTISVNNVEEGTVEVVLTGEGNLGGKVTYAPVSNPTAEVFVMQWSKDDGNPYTQTFNIEGLGNSEDYIIYAYSKYSNNTIQTSPRTEQTITTWPAKPRPTPFPTDIQPSMTNATFNGTSFTFTVDVYFDPTWDLTIGYGANPTALTYNANNYSSPIAGAEPYANIPPDTPVDFVAAVSKADGNYGTVTWEASYGWPGATYGTPTFNGTASTFVDLLTLFTDAAQTKLFYFAEIEENQNIYYKFRTPLGTSSLTASLGGASDINTALCDEAGTEIEAGGPYSMFTINPDTRYQLKITSVSSGVSGGQYGYFEINIS